MGRTPYTEPQCLYKGALYLTLPLFKQANKGSQMNSFEPSYIQLHYHHNERIWRQNP